jgi:hypothetical protein
MLRFIAFLIVGICMWANVATAQVLPANSIWQNQRGSIMKVFYVNPSTGVFNGIYVNNAVGFQSRGSPFDLNGRAIATGALSFKVVWKNSWQDCHSETTWYGRMAGQKIYTDWVLKKDGGGTLRGSDLFQRQ